MDMTFTPKPKNMSQFLQNTAAQDSHTWQTADSARPIVQSVGMSMAERRLKESRRQQIGSYERSNIANLANTQRRNIVEHTRSERQKISARMRSSEILSDNRRMPTSPQTPPVAPPSPTLYQRRPF